ncbi:MAG: preprotein translocase subunit SecE [Gaiellales bacterium]|jgi:preprotein translocase subunit SecE
MARTPRRNRPPAQRRSLSSPVAGRAKSQSGGEPVSRPSFPRRVFAFGGEVRSELGKVDFPNRQQTLQATFVVLGACLIVGLYLYGLDQAFARVASRIINWQNG